VETHIERRRAWTAGPRAYPERRSLFTREGRHIPRHRGSQDPEMAYPGEVEELDPTDGGSHHPEPEVQEDRGLTP
jgi:hypothetical protein